MKTNLFQTLKKKSASFSKLWNNAAACGSKGAGAAAAAGGAREVGRVVGGALVGCAGARNKWIRLCAT
jgi:hypothetical protein